MRIGIDARLWSEEHAGLSRYVRELVSNLAQIDSKNQYFLFLPKKFLKIKLPPNFKKIAADFPIYSIAEQTKFLKLINQYQLDLFHFTAFNHPVFYKKPCVITVHDLIIFLFPSKQKKSFFHRAVARIILLSALGKAKKIIVPSNSTKNDLVKYFKADPAKIVPIYHGVPKQFYPRSKEEIEKFLAQKKILPPFLLYIGQWRPHKNLVNLILAFNLARAKVPFKLVLGGKPDYQPVLDQIKKSPFKNDIKILGFVKDEELPLWYAGALAFIFPSLAEGFGYPVLEAAAVGTPVLASNATSLPEVLGEAGFYFNPKNPAEIADCMVQILKDSELRKELAQKSLKQAKKFSFKKMAQKTLSVYQEVCQLGL